MRKALCELRKPQCDSVLFLDVGRCFKSSTKESLLVHRPVGRSGKKVPLVRSMCMMECNNVLDANVMVNTCSITETKGWKRSMRVCGTTHTQHRIEHNVEAYQTVDGRKRKTVQYDGKVRPSGVVNVVRVWVGEGRKWENTGVGSKREGEKQRVSGEPGVLFTFGGGQAGQDNFKLPVVKVTRRDKPNTNTSNNWTLLREKERNSASLLMR